MPRALISAKTMRQIRALNERAMPETVTVVSRTPAPTGAGRLSAQSGDTGIEEEITAERGSYRLSLPAGGLELQPGELVTISSAPGRLFRVVWTPPVTALSAGRTVGLDEER